MSARIELALRIVRESRDAVEAEDQLTRRAGVGMDPHRAGADGHRSLRSARRRSAEDCASGRKHGRRHRYSCIDGGGPCQALTAALGAFPEEWVRTVEEVNNLNFEELTVILVAVRERRRVNNGWNRC